MKAPRDCAQPKDVQDLIDAKVPESLELDYKASGALDLDPSSNTPQHVQQRVEQLSKDVSSLANSAGGTLIYGVEEDQQHLPVKIDAGVDIGVLDRDRLENLIHGNVRPRLADLVVRDIALGNGRALYVVAVGQGMRAHMANDHRYYKRFNFKSAAMEHYEVEDVMHRQTAPDIRVFLRSSIQQLQQQPWWLITVMAENLLPVPAPFFAVRLYIPKHRRVQYIDSLGLPTYSGDPVRVQFPTFTEEFAVLVVEWHGRMPFLEGAANRLVAFNTDAAPGEWLLWQVQSSASPRRGAVLVAADGLHDREIDWREVRPSSESH